MKVIQIVTHENGLFYVLSDTGRVFCRIPQDVDKKNRSNYNDYFQWGEVRLPDEFYNQKEKE